MKTPTCMRMAVCGLAWRIAVLLVGVMLAGGCASQTALEQDVRQSRLQDYERWRDTGGQINPQEPSITGELDLTDAVKLALQYNQTLQAVMQESDIARGQALAADARALPSVMAEGSYTRLSEAPHESLGDQVFPVGVINNYSVGLLVRQPLFEGGAIQAARRAARLQVAVTDTRIRAQVQATIFATISAYLDTLLAQHFWAVDRDAVAAATAHLDDVQKRRKVGTVSDYEVLRAEVEVSNFRAEEIRERNRVTMAKTSLLKEMGVQQEQALTLADVLAYQPVQITWPDVVQQALEQRPELGQAELNVRLQREALISARSPLFPKVSAIFTENIANPDPNTVVVPDWGSQWMAGIAVELPIFELNLIGNLATERARLRQREAQLNDARERVLLEVRQAWMTLQNAAEFVDSQKMNLGRAAESLRLAEVGYHEGLQSQVEVTDAQAAVTRTRGLYYQAIYDHCLARLTLQRAMGLLGPTVTSRLDIRAPVQPSAQPAPPALAPDVPRNKHL